MKPTKLAELSENADLIKSENADLIKSENADLIKSENTETIVSENTETIVSERTETIVSEIKEFFGPKYPANLIQTVSIVGGSFSLGKYDRPDHERHWDIRKNFLHEQNTGMLEWVYKRVKQLRDK